MPLNLDENTAQYQIKGHRPGEVQINDQVFHHSIIISPEKLIKDWPPQTLAELKWDHLVVLLGWKPDILLIGTGETLIFPPISLYGELINHGIGVEIMNTHAACRTYQALTAENRNVVAALLLK